MCTPAGDYDLLCTHWGTVSKKGTPQVSLTEEVTGVVTVEVEESVTVSLSSRLGVLMNDRLDSLLAFLESTARDASEQVPLVAEEIVRWHVFAHAAGFIVGTLFVVAGIAAMWRAWKTWEINAIGGADFLLVGGGGALVGGAITALVQGSLLLKGLLAPRIVVLDYVRDCLNQ
jgi:hypothetical protein